MINNRADQERYVKWLKDRLDHLRSLDVGGTQRKRDIEECERKLFWAEQRLEDTNDNA